MNKEKKSLAKKKKVQAAKKEKTMALVKGIGTTVAILAVLALFGVLLYLATDTDTAEAEYSGVEGPSAKEVITAEGYISEIKDIEKYIKPIDYKNITVSKDSVTVTEDYVNETIDTLLKNNPETVKTGTVADGDKVDIAYIGRNNGEIFDSNESYVLEIGSNTFVDNFEEQLIGAKVGETVTVNITFPDPYTNNTDLSGQPAEFEVTINGIQKEAEFNDDFVKRVAPEFTSAEAYKQDIIDKKYDSLLETAIVEKISELAEAKKTPKKFAEYLATLVSSEALYNYSYMQYYYSMFGMSYYSSFSEYILASTDNGGLGFASIDAYEDACQKNGKEISAYYMAMQYIFEKEGLTSTQADLCADYVASGKTEEDWATYVEENGSEAYAQNYISEKVVELLKKSVKVQ